MASTGNTLPTVGASVDRAGSTAWTSPGNVVSDNATDTTAAVPTDYLVTSTYGFAVPADNVIVGVTVRVEASETGTGNSNYVPQLHSDATPTLIGSAKSAVTVNGTTKVISTNGGIGDRWGADITPAIVNAAGFGVSIWSTDATNTLAIDYVTIAIEYTTVAPITQGEHPAMLRRRNVTRHRLQQALDAPQKPGTPSNSSDRSLTAAFQTNTLRSRRSLAMGWMAAMTTATPATVIPPAAWMTTPQRRRHVTARRLLTPEPMHWPYIAPTMAPLLAPPKANVVRFERRIQLPAPQELFPPATGPPPNGIGDPLALRIRAIRGKRFVPVLVPPVYPATPLAPTIPAAIDRPAAFRRRQTSFHALRVSALDFTASTGTLFITARVSDKAHRVEFNRQLILPLWPPVYPQTAVSLQYSALVLLTAHRTEFKRTLQRIPELDSYPVAAVEASADRTLTSQFVTRTIRSRRLRLAPAMLAVAAAPPGTSQADEPAFRFPRAKRIEFTRRLIPAPDQITYPATPAPPVQPQVATVLVKVKRRKARQGLFLTAGEAPESRVTAQYPSYKAPKALKRRATHRTLKKAPPTPRYPLAAVSGAVIAALAPKQLRKRKGHQIGFVSFGATFGDADAVTPPNTSTDHTAGPSFRVKGVRGKHLVKGLIAPVYPLTPPTAQGYPARLSVGYHRRKKTEHRLLSVQSVPLYAATPPTAQGYPSWLLKLAYRAEARCILQLPAHNSSYPQTPVPPQPYTASLLPRTYFSSQLRKLQPQFPLLEYPPSPPIVVVSPVDEGGGGWEPFYLYAARRRHEKYKAEHARKLALEEAKDDAAQAEIARLLHFRLQQEEEAAELERLKALVLKAGELTSNNLRVQTALAKARSERTFSRLQALQRELIRLQEEEEMALLMILLADE